MNGNIDQKWLRYSQFHKKKLQVIFGQSELPSNNFPGVGFKNVL